MELIIPLTTSKELSRFRVTGFFDIGNVYGPDEDFDLREPARMDIHTILEERRARDDERIARNKEELDDARSKLANMTRRDIDVP